MVDVNLLPDELRGREAAERKRLQKTPKVVEFPLSSPTPAETAKLGPGGSGFGRPPPPHREVRPVEPHTAPPPPPLPALPPRPERRHFTFTRGLHPPPTAAPAQPEGVRPHLPAAPAVKPLDAAEAARLAAAVRREVSVTEDRAAKLPSRRHRRGFLSWLSELFHRRPKAVTPPSVPPPTPPPPPPKPPVLPPRPVTVKVVSPPAPRRTQPRPRRSFWFRLRGLFLRQRTAPVPPPPVMPPPVPPPPPPAIQPAAPTVKAAPPPAHPKPARRKAGLPPPAEPAVGRPIKTLAINLIPEEFAQHPELNLSRKFLLYLASLGVSVFAILTVSQVIGWYHYLIGDQIRQSQRQIDEYLRQIDQYQGLVAQATAKLEELRRIEQLLSGHRYLTQLFGHLQRLTIDEVSYTSLALAGEGTVTLHAIGRDYASVARQLVAFQEATDVVRDVSILGASGVAAPGSRRVEQVTFSISLEFTPAAYLTPITTTPSP